MFAILPILVHVFPGVSGHSLTNIPLVFCFHQVSDNHRNSNTSVIRPNTIINLFLGWTNPQHADWLNAILPRICVMNNNIAYRPILSNVDIQPLCSEDFNKMDIGPTTFVS